ncbi:hypothetical protein [Ensifer aridi]|uniref:hypothetical protein n=1 Tax=Ensifer aridi TaxID=1708715 RepID=UPI003B847AC1
MRNQSTSSLHFQRKISEFCNVRIAPVASKRALQNIRPYLISLVSYRKTPPMRNGRINWQAVTEPCGIEDELTAEMKKTFALALKPSSGGWTRSDRRKMTARQSSSLEETGTLLVVRPR